MSESPRRRPSVGKTPLAAFSLVSAKAPDMRHRRRLAGRRGGGSPYGTTEWFLTRGGWGVWLWGGSRWDSAWPSVPEQLASGPAGGWRCQLARGGGGGCTRGQKGDPSPSPSRVIPISRGDIPIYARLTMIVTLAA